MPIYTVKLPPPTYGPPEPSPTPDTTETYVVTAYAVGDRYTPSHGITASGKRVKANETIACPREIPLGTHVTIEGVGERVCLDRGSKIRGKRLDVYVPSIREAIDFGVQRLDVTINDETE